MNPTDLPPLETSPKSRSFEAPQKSISIVIPVHNEEVNVPLIYKEVHTYISVLPYKFSIVFVDDGSTDNTVRAINDLIKTHSEVKSIELSRNFGKEVAVSAGIDNTDADAVICLDADLQHPPSLIPQFIREWERGAEVVIGVRNSSRSDTLVKRIGSRLFYKIMNWIGDSEIIPRATDFRLLDENVVTAFKALKEHNRMNRGLIDWLGFRSSIIKFDAPERQNGGASYTTWKLVKLAIATFISMSLWPLWMAGLFGVCMFILSTLLFILMLIDRFLHIGYNFSGPAILVTVNVLLVSIMLMCVGIVGFYVAHIHHETQGRPLYVVRKKKL